MTATVSDSRLKRPWPATLIAGLALIAACEILLLADVVARGGIVVPAAPLPPPEGGLGQLARIAARYVTPLCWTGFLLAADGLLLRWTGQSPVRRRPWRFVLAYLTSIPVWLYFDWVNFGYMGAWTYYGLPDDLTPRWIGYFFAFGAISPAMFLAAEGFARTRLGELRGPPLRFGRPAKLGMLGVGGAFLVFPILAGDPIGTLTLWLGVVLLLDPINRRLGQPSLLADWADGRYGRTAALMAGGLLCGLLWEFWNYWAVAKWTYDLPFLGPLEDVRYFEMPVPGLGGFLPFALECWAAFQTCVWLAGRLGWRRIEPLPEDGIL